MMKRILIWLLGIIAVLVVAIILAFRFTPWPSVAIIQYAFSRGD
jgi:acetyl esterase